MADNNKKQPLPGVIFASVIGICALVIVIALTVRVVRWIGGF